MAVRLGVIGAGAAAAAATYVIGSALPATETVVFEKSRGVCGRAAARRRGGITYDYGANYLKDTGGRVSTLVTEELSDGLVEIQGPIWTFDAGGYVSVGPGGQERRWTYEDGITRFAKHLFGTAGVEVRRGTRITDIRRDEKGRAGDWALTDADGVEYGPFDALLVNPPAPQTADLLCGTGVRAVDRLSNAASEIGYRSIWTAVLGYGFEIDQPYYALARADEDCEVGWIGREERKPGHVPDGESVLVVQAGPEWSAERYDDPSKNNVADLAVRTAEIVGDRRLADPDWTDHQGWRYALPNHGVSGEGLQAAASEGVYATGDWVAGEGKLHAAVRNGLETGRAMANTLAGE